MAVGGGTLEKDSLGGVNILDLSLPGLEHGFLESATVGESESPGLLDTFHGVHGIEVKGSILLRLATREEAHDGDCGDESARKSADGGPCDLFRGFTVGAFSAGGDHVRLEHASLEEEVMVEHGLLDSGEDTLGNLSASVNIVGTILENLGLYDGDKAVLLADGTVAGESVGSLLNSKVGGEAITDLEDRAPLGKTASLFVEGLGTGSKTVESLSGGLVLGSHKVDKALVELDADMDATAAEVGYHVGTVGDLLIDGLLVHDDTGDVFLDLGGGDKEITVGASVFLSVLDVDGVEALADGTSGLVSGEDTLTSGSDLLGGLNKFSLKVKFSFNHCVF